MQNTYLVDYVAAHACNEDKAGGQIMFLDNLGRNLSDHQGADEIDINDLSRFTDGEVNGWTNPANTGTVDYASQREARTCDGFLECG